MRLTSLVVPFIAVMAASCGGTNEPTRPLGTNDPPPSFPNVAGTWRGTLNYSACAEPEGFGVCAGVHAPTSMPLQMTITQSPTTHVVSGLKVADITGTISFGGLTGTLTGVVDDIGSVFFDDDAFTAPLPPDHTARVRGWIGQLDNTSFFMSFRIFITANSGKAGQAIVGGNMLQAVRAAR